MKKLMMIVGVAALAAPGLASAEVGIRLGLETPIWSHVDSSGQSASFSIGDTFRPAINALIEYYPISNVGLGIEATEGFLATGTVANCTGGNCGYQRLGTNIGPNVTLDLVPVPIYLRAALPIHLEPGDVTWNFRAAGGLKIGVPAFSVYLEALADFPLAGSGITPFKSGQQFGAGAGIWVKF